VGRLVDLKNPLFTVDVLQKMAQSEPRARLLFLGVGPLQSELERHVQQRGLRDSVVFGGFRTDVPRILADITDLFLMPSKYEGLGLAFLEAQAAGVPCLVSNAIPVEAVVIPTLVSRLSTLDDAQTWAARAIEILRYSPRIPAVDARVQLEGGPFDAVNSVRSVLRLYTEARTKEAPLSNWRSAR
jgi:glycosyltransferase involved in cell wall biosynthesis